MWRYIVKRLLSMIPVLIGVSFIIFTLLYFTPGDPAPMVLGEQASEEAKNEWREEYGLNDSFWTQYFRYIKDIITEKSILVHTATI